MNLQILEAQLKFERAKVKYETAIHRVQSACSHTNIAECDAHHMMFGNALSPIRICLDCGLTEEVSFAYGIKVLKNPEPKLGLRKIAREELYKLRVGEIISNGECDE